MLLEQRLAALVLDRGTAHFPINGIERRAPVFGAKRRVDLQPAVTSTKLLAEACACVFQTVFRIDFFQRWIVREIRGASRKDRGHSFETPLSSSVG
jgi:hypothetical protein